jgi:hypothetical protein
MIPNFARKRQQQQPGKDTKLAQQTASVTLHTARTLKSMLDKYPQLTGVKP